MALLLQPLFWVLVLSLMQCRLSTNGMCVVFSVVHHLEFQFGTGNFCNSSGWVLQKGFMSEPVAH